MMASNLLDVVSRSGLLEMITPLDIVTRCVVRPPATITSKDRFLLASSMAITLRVFPFWVVWFGKGGMFRQDGGYP